MPNDPVKQKVFAAAHYARNRETILSKNAAWRAANKDRKAATDAKWRKANPDKRAIIAGRIPLIRGGKHSYENTQLSHATCNLVKGVS